jgi:hypothetical protein
MCSPVFLRGRDKVSEIREKRLGREGGTYDGPADIVGHAVEVQNSARTP